MADLPPDDARDQILQELEAVSQRSPAEQERWLERLREKYRGHPQAEQIVAKFELALQATKQMLDARLGLARVEEMLEADVVSKLNGVLDGSLALPGDDLERLKLVLYISLAGHFLANVRARLEQADAQTFIRAQMATIIGGSPG